MIEENGERGGVADNQIEASIVIVIAERAAHAAAGHPVFVVADTGEGGGFSKCAITVVLIKEISLHIVGDVQVCVAIVIVITDCHGEAKGAMRYSRSLRYISKGAIAVIAIEDIGFADEVTAGNPVGGTTIGSDAARLPPSVLFQRKFHIVDDVEIRVAI